MSRLLVVATLAWPLLLGSAAWARHGAHAPLWATAMYAAASRVCHQRPDRSFFTAGVQWPVCGRCSGLYLTAPIGALLALGARSRRQNRSGPARGARLLVGVASIPTLITLALEWLRLAPVSNLVRAAAAAPLGLAIAYVLVAVTKPLENDRVH